MKELIIAENMVALARGRKHHGSHQTEVKSAAKKRSAMLKMIMPFLSRETGEKLAIAIEQRNPAKFNHIWDQIKREIANKLEHAKVKSVASATVSIQMPDDMLICIIEKVCKRMCEGKDPCPLPPIECKPVECKPNEKPLNVQTDWPNLYDLYQKMVANSR